MYIVYYRHKTDRHLKSENKEIFFLTDTKRKIKMLNLIKETVYI